MRAGGRVVKREIKADQHFTEPPPRYSEASPGQEAWRSWASAGPRPTPRSSPCCATATMCGWTRTASCPRTRAAWSPPSWSSSSPLRRIRLHRRPGGEARPGLGRRAGLEGAAARILEGLPRRRRRDRGLQISGMGERSTTRPGSAHLPGKRGRHRSARLPDLRRGAASLKPGRYGAFIGCSNYPECRYTRPIPRRRPSGEAPGDRELGVDPATGEVTVAQRPLRALWQPAKGDASPSAPACPRTGAAARWTSTRPCAALAAARGGPPSRGRRPIVAGIGRYGPYVQHNGT